MPNLVFTSSVGTGLDRLGQLGAGAEPARGNEAHRLFESDQDGGPASAHHRALDGQSVFFDIKWSLRNYRAQMGPLKESAGRVIGTICGALHEVPVPSDEFPGGDRPTCPANADLARPGGKDDPGLPVLLPGSSSQLTGGSGPGPGHSHLATLWAARDQQVLPPEGYRNSDWPRD